MNTASPCCSPACVISGTEHESTHHRQRRTRARTGLEVRAVAARHGSRSWRPAMRAPRASSRCAMSPSASMQIDALADLATSEGVALTIVGPEGPLVAGIIDLFRERGLQCFGPSKAAAQLEGSKAFSKAFLERHRIPTAGYRRFTRDELRPRLAGCAARADRGQGQRTRCRQGRDHRGHGRRGGRSGRIHARRTLRRCRRRNRDRGIPRRRGSQLHRDLRWPSMRCRWPAARITSDSGMATRARTPAAWAPIHPRPSSRPWCTSA